MLIFALALSAGCASSRISAPDPRFENFYDRHIGDNLATDALSGFAPTAILGFLADAIERPVAKNPAPAKKMEDGREK